MVSEAVVMERGGNQLYAFAVKSAKWFCRQRSLRRHQHEDVLQDMLVGISQASSRFDAARGVSFETFARKRMFGETIDGLARRGGVPRAAWARGVRCPRSLFEEADLSVAYPEIVDTARLVHAYRILDDVSPLLRRAVEAVHSENATPSEVAVELGLTIAQVRQFLIRGLQLLQLKLATKTHRGVTMDATQSHSVFSAAQWRAELRKVVRRLVTPDVIQQLVQRQIEMAKAGDRHALNFLLKQCGLNESINRGAIHGVPASTRAQAGGTLLRRGRVPRTR